MRILDEMARHEFDKFLAKEGYENVQGMMLHLVRDAFIAGYYAASSLNDGKTILSEGKISEKT